MERRSTILDHSGKHFVVLTQEERAEIGSIGRAGNPSWHPVQQRATYDAARTTDEFENYWANADRFDADSAHSRQVRHTLMSRSRYEIANNGYADGIAQTYATDLVGVGPSLRMQTRSTGFNQLVEFNWRLWSKLVHLRRKLWCMAHAKHSDGEAIAALRRNPKLRKKYPLDLDLRLYEADQCQTPYLPWEPGYIDGIKFDEFGNPEHYDILPHHPGASGMMSTIEPERVPADRVLHWFKMRRPGQHRAVPECASTLNVGAASRRMREATVATVENGANFSVLLKTQMMPDEFEGVEPMSTLETRKRMMVALPDGYDAYQMKSEHPNATYDSFLKGQINEQARPKSMPYNKAACDSSNYNYASGRLDHQTYYAEMDVDREDGNDLVLEPLFNLWFDLAIATFGWLGGDPDAVGLAARNHSWDWPQHRVADIKAEAQANAVKLTTGQETLPRLYSNAGLDFEDEVIEMAKAYGVTVDEMRLRILDSHYPPKAAPAEPSGSTDIEEAVEAAFEELQLRASRLHNANGNGALHHAN